MKRLLRRLWRLRFRWYALWLAGPALLRQIGRQKPEAFFVQVGANDGAMMDPLRKQVLSSRWRGLVIEPVPQLFAQLERNYAAAAGRVRAVNLAIATQDGELPFYHLADRPGLPSLPDWVAGLGSFRRDVVLKHADRIPQLERYLSEIQVPAVTWRTLCQRHGVERIDVLVTDTEGYDFEIIRQVDFTRHRPLLLIYEHHHFDDDTRKACHALLHANGYTLFEEGLDTWALHAEAGAELHALLSRATRRSRYAVPVNAGTAPT